MHMRFECHARLMMCVMEAAVFRTDAGPYDEFHETAIAPEGRAPVHVEYAAALGNFRVAFYFCPLCAAQFILFHYAFCWNVICPAVEHQEINLVCVEFALYH